MKNNHDHISFVCKYYYMSMYGNSRCKYSVNCPILSIRSSYNFYSYCESNKGMIEFDWIDIARIGRKKVDNIILELDKNFTKGDK